MRDGPQELEDRRRREADGRDDREVREGRGVQHLGQREAALLARQHRAPQGREKLAGEVEPRIAGLRDLAAAHAQGDARRRQAPRRSADGRGEQQHGSSMAGSHNIMHSRSILLHLGVHL